ncbi:hypothetical protein ACU635_50955 [[Actinomadura] parvosata]|uniref:hypothetical protein n=1 Tax=[Actinomadura] parvosata TaxID=1955412 RepID=UPI00406C5E0C
MLPDLPWWLLSIGRCPACRIACYESRRAARKAGRSKYPGKRVRAFRCDGGSWHFAVRPRRSYPGVAAWSLS